MLPSSEQSPMIKTRLQSNNYIIGWKCYYIIRETNCFEQWGTWYECFIWLCCHVWSDCYSKHTTLLQPLSCFLFINSLIWELILDSQTLQIVRKEVKDKLTDLLFSKRSIMSSNNLEGSRPSVNIKPLKVKVWVINVNATSFSRSSLCLPWK